MKPYPHRARIVSVLVSEKIGASGDPGTHAPRTVAASTPAPPMSDASTTRPLRILYIHRPTKSAMGIVHAIVNVPHELPGTTWTALSGTLKIVPSGVLVSALPAMEG